MSEAQKKDSAARSAHNRSSFDVASDLLGFGDDVDIGDDKGRNDWPITLAFDDLFSGRSAAARRGNSSMDDDGIVRTMENPILSKRASSM